MDNTVTKEALNTACERFLARFLRGQLAELEMMGAGDIDYADRARAYLRRYDYDAAEASAASPRGGHRHLKAV